MVRIKFDFCKSLVLGVLFFITAVFFMGCGASTMTGYYADLKKDLTAEKYTAAAEIVNKSEKQYGTKNILMFNLDAGLTNHYAGIYDTSRNYFESAKANFDDYYTKSISAGALSFVTNDLAMPYYGQDFESVHINVFNALNYILAGDDNDAAVEARQADALFSANYRKLYKDDGFVRYFMGLVYENADYLNDAYTSYNLALNAYKNGISGVTVPKDLINDAYKSALKLGLKSEAAKIKSQYPTAEDKEIPSNFGEVIVIDYNGLVPEKIETIIELGVGDAWGYVNAKNVDSQEQKDFETVKSVGVAAFTNDYIKLAFPAYRRIPHNVNSFAIETPSGTELSYVAQDIATIAEKTLENYKNAIYAKTVASAVVKYVAGSIVAKKVEQEKGALAGMAAKKAFNIAMALLAQADTRSWITLPENILMSRFFLQEGTNEITIYYLDKNNRQVKTEKKTIDVKRGKKNFIVIESFK
ncbi:MAG: hypothetical protein LBV66_00270 [Elusimicrobiota bacterium]|jgi:hypothetical protein|nr:hypothetical protein [Elusimicrobiota bacterium]